MSVFFFKDALDKMMLPFESPRQTTLSMNFLWNYWHSDILEVQMQSLSFVRFWFVKMIPLQVWVKNVKDADKLQTDEEGMKLIQKKTQLLEDQLFKRHPFIERQGKTSNNT